MNLLIGLGMLIGIFHDVGFIGHRVPSLPSFCAENEEILIKIFAF